MGKIKGASKTVPAVPKVAKPQSTVPMKKQKTKTSKGKQAAAKNAPADKELLQALLKMLQNDKSTMKQLLSSSQDTEMADDKTRKKPRLHPGTKSRRQIPKFATSSMPLINKTRFRNFLKSFISEVVDHDEENDPAELKFGSSYVSGLRAYADYLGREEARSAAQIANLDGKVHMLSERHFWPSFAREQQIPVVVSRKLK